MASDPSFPLIQRRLAQLGLYSKPVNDQWGAGMAAGIDTLLSQAEKARGITGTLVPANAGLPKLPPEYSWVANIGPLPRHVVQMLGLFGTKEVLGAGNSPVIMGWVQELASAGIGIDLRQVYTADSLAWCGLAMAVAMLRAGRDVVTDPLWALNWGKWGEDGGQPELGDLLTFERFDKNGKFIGGHVALYIGEDREGYFHILGGNQSDSVSFTRIARKRMKACRQPPYKTKPACVRPYQLAPGGAVSTNEA